MKIKFFLVSLLLIIIFGSFTACSPKQNVNFNGDYQILSIQLDGKDLIIPDGLDIYLKFVDSSNINANVGCNSISSEYENSAGKISFSKTISTLMACEEPLMNLETGFVAVLESVNKYSIKPNSQLVLSSEDGKNIIVLSQNIQ